MNVDKIGEFGLIERIKSILNNPTGIGDDAAVFQSKPGFYSLITTDSFVEGVHFKRNFATLRQIGKRVMAASLSDIAAMGGEPRQAVISLCLPEKVQVEEVEEFYKGALELSGKFGCTIVGGDTVIAPVMVIAVTVFGETEKQRLSLRSEAKVGDVLCVTGELGGSKAGLQILQEEKEPIGDAPIRYLEPLPRIKEARAIGEIVPIHAMIDISDGLSSEVNHICQQSNVGAEISARSIPIHEAAWKLSGGDFKKALDYALSGGEDFELLLTLDPVQLEKLKNNILIKVKLSTIGQIVEKQKGIHIFDGKRKTKLFPLGYQHF